MYVNFSYAIDVNDIVTIIMNYYYKFYRYCTNYSPVPTFPRGGGEGGTRIYVRVYHIDRGCVHTSMMEHYVLCYTFELFAIVLNC